MSIYDTYKKVIGTGNECGDCETIHCIGSENLKETLYFYEGILGIKPSLERPQLDVTGFGMMPIQRELVLL